MGRVVARETQSSGGHGVQIRSWQYRAVATEIAVAKIVTDHEDHVGLTWPFARIGAAYGGAGSKRREEGGECWNPQGGGERFHETSPMEWHGIQAPFEVATKWMRAN